MWKDNSLLIRVLKKNEMVANSIKSSLLLNIKKGVLKDS